MCLALLKRPGAYLPDEYLRTAWQNNPDGAGYMFADSGKLTIDKGYRSVDTFLAAFRRTESKHRECPRVLHFRWATHGDKIESNCHPFQVFPGIGMAHNGILPIDMPYNGAQSDTAHFVELLQAIGSPDMLHAASLGLLARWIESDNKLVFLDRLGTCHIVNESSGKWVDGCWYSNDPEKKAWRYVPATSGAWAESDYTDEGTRKAWAEYYPNSHSEIVGYPLDKYSCRLCNAKLPKELWGVSEMCWECVSEQEESTEHHREHQA